MLFYYCEDSLSPATHSIIQLFIPGCVNTHTRSERLARGQCVVEIRSNAENSVANIYYRTFPFHNPFCNPQLIELSAINIIYSFYHKFLASMKSNRAFAGLCSLLWNSNKKEIGGGVINLLRF